MSELKVKSEEVEENEEEILNFQIEESLAEEKFEDLRKTLQSLKEENKKQMDIIINSLDELMANKTYIDETLKDLNIMNDEIDSNALVDGPFKVVDYLAKITGYESENVISTDAAEKKQNHQNVQLSDVADVISQALDENKTANDDVKMETDEVTIKKECKDATFDVREVADVISQVLNENTTVDDDKDVKSEVLIKKESKDATLDVRNEIDTIPKVLDEKAIECSTDNVKKD